jgi:hypothetical protein
MMAEGCQTEGVGKVKTCVVQLVLRSLEGLPEVESSKPSDPALPDFRQLQAKQELRLSQSLS